jgi:hypothetical protein
MNCDLALALFDSGIVQFGQFMTSSGAAPMRLDFAMLASYAKVNSLLAQACIQHLQLDSDEVRLCCALDTLPVGLVIGQILERPIIYTASREHELPREFIGAYDVGHPTVLLWSWPKSLCSDEWKHQMSQVGLQFHRNLYIVGGRDSALPIDYLLDCLVTADRIRPVQAEACLHWLQVS